MIYCGSNSSCLLLLFQLKVGIQLKKCSKLSELRAQLLKVQQCDAKLEQFRDTVRQAQFEAEGASMLVTKSMGGIPSPRKTMCEWLNGDNR